LSSELLSEALNLGSLFSLKLSALCCVRCHVSPGLRRIVGARSAEAPHNNNKALASESLLSCDQQDSQDGADYSSRNQSRCNGVPTMQAPEAPFLAEPCRGMKPAPLQLLGSGRRCKVPARPATQDPGAIDSSNVDPPFQGRARIQAGRSFVPIPPAAGLNRSALEGTVLRVPCVPLRGPRGFLAVLC
jgi:hypothetical protein